MAPRKETVVGVNSEGRAGVHGGPSLPMAFTPSITGGGRWGSAHPYLDNQRTQTMGTDAVDGALRDAQHKHAATLFPSACGMVPINVIVSIQG